MPHAQETPRLLNENCFPLKTVFFPTTWESNRLVTYYLCCYGFWKSALSKKLLSVKIRFLNFQDHGLKMEISVERALKYFLHGVVFLGCLIFTLYQSYNCFMKYHSFPKGTSIGFHSTNGVGENFPAISICSRYDNYMDKYLAFNETALRKCGHAPYKW